MTARSARRVHARLEHTRDGAGYRVRPIRPDDAERERVFVRELRPESRRNRFMCGLRELPDDLLQRFTHVDHDRTMAYVATVGDPPDERIVGASRYAADGDDTCEFATTVADDWQGRGVGSLLTREIIDHARRRGFNEIHGTLFAANDRMIDLARALGFSVRMQDGCPGVLELHRKLTGEE